MGSVMLKTTLREIRQSLGRYIAILAIVGLGVGCFAGLKATKPAMVRTVEGYLNELDFYDFKLMSTLGFDDQDIETFQAQKEVETAVGSYSFDILCQSSVNENSFVMRTHSITEDVNTLYMIAGRMPEKGFECVVDSTIFSEDSIGQKLILSQENHEEDIENFNWKEFTIVGVVQSPLYIQFERGNTSLGNGQVTGFAYLLPEAYDSAAYTEVYIKFDDDFPLHSDAYNDFIADKEEDWELILKEAADRRAEDIREEAYEKLEEARSDLEREKIKAQKELDDAKQQIEDGRKQIEDGKEQIRAGWEELTDQEKLLVKGEKELNDNENLLLSKETELNAGILTWQENSQKLLDGKSQLRAAESEISSKEGQLVMYEQMMGLLGTLITNMEDSVEKEEASIALNEAQVTEKEKALLLYEEQMKNLYGEELPQEISTQIANENREIAAEKNEIAQRKQAVVGEKLLLEQLRKEYNEYNKQIEDGRVQLNDAKLQVLNGWAELDKGEQELNKAWADIVSGRAQIDAGKTQIAEGKREIAEGKIQISDAKKELQKNEDLLVDKEKELLEGEKEYEEGLLEFEEKMAEAEKELLDAQRKVDEINDPDTYVLDRNTNVGYVCFESDSNIVNDVAKVFPVFFFMVAALVCMTTMSRMIEEQRTQIGVLKGLGYSEWVIMAKYLVYSGSAALIGCILGFFLFTFLFPTIIWFCYGMMYDVVPTTYYFDPGMLIIGVIVSLLCSVGTTWYCCRNELKEVAAQLMRPKTPEAGKRIFLEKIEFIWKRLKFLQKVSIRNVFRYKRRFFMMIIGISGCTALIIAGLGINDSIKGIVDKQYKEIMKYDMSVTFSDEITEEVLAEFEKVTDDKILSYTKVMESALDLKIDGITKSMNLVVFEDTGSVAEYMDIHTTKNKKLPFPVTGQAIISHKIADTYRIAVGDSITLADKSQKEMTVVVSGINENFVMNYAFMNADTYEQALKDPIKYRTLYVNVPEDKMSEIHQLSAEIMEIYEVAAVSINQDSIDRLNIMLSSLDYIVGLIILCAAALAFIVLYNLTNINITERVREIATIKVLGFYKKETCTYVFRENMMLTVIGGLFGLIMGKFFHAFVMSCIRVDMVSFETRITPLSYLLAFILTYLFASFVNLVMHKKIERISMTESLKSVD